MYKQYFSLHVLQLFHTDKNAVDPSNIFGKSSAS